MDSKLRALAEGTDNINMCLMDTEGRVLYLDSAARKLLGAAPDDELWLSDVVAPEYLAERRRELLWIANTGKSVREVRRSRPNSGLWYIEGHPIEGGLVLYFAVRVAAILEAAEDWRI